MNQRRIFSGWDVRMRLAAAVLWLMGFLFLNRAATLWLLAGILVFLIAADSGMSIRTIGHQLLHALPFVALMMITLSLSSGFPIRRDAVKFAVLLSSRVLAGVIVVLAMIGSGSADDFIRGIAVLPIPPVLLSLMFLVNRYVHLLTREFRRQSMALRSRMFVPKANPGVLKNIGFVVGGMFIRSYDRSEHVYAAMRARCYTGVIPFDDAGPIRLKDIIGLIAAAALITGAILLERMWLA